MGASSTRKGKVGEREWANKLREFFPEEHISRGQQGAGGHNDPDVKGLEGWWCEVKRVERFSVWGVLQQLIKDWVKGSTRRKDKPMVAFRRNRGRWWVILRAEDWAQLIRQVERAESELIAFHSARREREMDL